MISQQCSLINNKIRIRRIFKLYCKLRSSRTVLLIKNIKNKYIGIYKKIFSRNTVYIKYVLKDKYIVSKMAKVNKVT